MDRWSHGTRRNLFLLLTLGLTAACAGVAAASAPRPDGGELLLQDHLASPERFDVSPAGPIVATVGRLPRQARDGSPLDHLYAWDLRTGRPLWRVDDEEYDVYNLDFSPDGRTLATTAFDPHRPTLWDAATGERLRELGATGQTEVRYGPRGERILLSPSTVLVDPGTGDVLRELSAVRGGPISPDGRLLAEIQGNVRLWDIEGDSLLREIGHARGRRLHGPDIDEAGFHPDGGRILTGGYILQPTVYDVHTGDTLATYHVPEATLDDIVAVFGHYSPDGGHVLTRVETGTEAWLWSAGARVPEVVFVSDSPIRDAAFEAEGRLLITTHADASTRVWDMRGKELFRRYLVGDDGWVVTTPDERYDGSPDALQELRRVQGTRSSPVDPAADPAHVPGLVGEVIRERYGQLFSSAGRTPEEDVAAAAPR